MPPHYWSIFDVECGSGSYLVFLCHIPMMNNVAVMGAEWCVHSCSISTQYAPIQTKVMKLHTRVPDCISMRIASEECMILMCGKNSCTYEGDLNIVHEAVGDDDAGHHVVDATANDDIIHTVFMQDIGFVL